MSCRADALVRAGPPGPGSMGRPTRASAAGRGACPTSGHRSRWSRLFLFNTGPRELVLVAGLIMIAEEVDSEVAFVITPYRMNMIRIVLRIVVFDQECRSLNAIVVRIAFFDAACPREVQAALAFLEL